MKRKIFKVFYLFFLTPTVLAENNFSKLLEFSQQAYTASSDKAPMPLISLEIPNADQSQAYHAQSLLVKKILNANPQDAIRGYKAGLTSKLGQKKFRVSSPIYGVLFAKGETRQKQSVNLSSAYKLMLETEVGFILANDIVTPLSSIEQLKSYIESVLPVIELPDLAFDNLSKLTGINIVATNVASNRYILGDKHTLLIDFSLNSLTTQLTVFAKDGSKNSVVITGKGSDASGDQWKALLDLVNHQLEKGNSLKREQLLITGALGKMVPATIGNYRADFGRLGQINFNINR